MDRTMPTNEPGFIENHIIEFLESRIETFKRADCDLMAELISIKINVPLETVLETIENFLATQKKIVVKNSSYFLNS